MDTLTQRIEEAQVFWHAGSTAERAGDFRLAYEHYTRAHDLIMDCAKLHQRAHEHLRRVNWKLGNYGELVTDWALHIFAVFGVFEAVSYFSRTEAFGSSLCKRGT